MTTASELEAIVSACRDLPTSSGTAREALTLVVDRLHLAKDPKGRLELFLEGAQSSFGHAVIGKALEFGEYQELNERRTFTAVLIRSSTADIRLMAHVAYEAANLLTREPQISNESLLQNIGPYLNLVLDREILATEQQLGLVGELLFLSELLNRAADIGGDVGDVLQCWTGWDSASRDFAGDRLAVECKVTRGAGRTHMVHPIYQLLAAGGAAERVYVFSVGISLDRSRDYRLVTAIDRVAAQLPLPAKETFFQRLALYGGVGYDESLRRTYELEAGFLITQPPVLIRVDHLGDILRPESFRGGEVPRRASDVSYRVILDGLSVASREERLLVLDAFIGGLKGSGNN